VKTISIVAVALTASSSALRAASSCTALYAKLTRIGLSTTAHPCIRSIVIVFCHC